MKFRPLHDRVLVKRIEGDEKSSGGIIIPDSAQEKPSEGEVQEVMMEKFIHWTSKQVTKFYSENGQVLRLRSTVKILL